MSKKRKLSHVDLSDWPTTAFPGIDWAQCLLCQTGADQVLIQPTLAGYRSLIEHLTEFAKHDALPRTVRLQQMDDGSGLLQTFVSHNAQYHKSCRSKYDSQKVARLQARGERDEIEVESGTSSRTTRSSHEAFDIKSVCLFCEDDQTNPKEKLVQASTMSIGETILSHATDLQDTRLLAKLSSTDLVALEAKYHNTCLVKFLNRARSYARAQRQVASDPKRVTYGLVVRELVDYIQDMFLFNETAPVFKLSKLTKLVSTRMVCLGVPIEDQSVNRTRLKDELLSFIPGLREGRCGQDGREVVLLFDADVGNAVRDACQINDVSDGMCLARAANILRRDMFKDFPVFTGTFKEPFTDNECVPLSLRNFTTMLLEGSQIDACDDDSEIQSKHVAALSIAQLVRFNSIKRARNDRPANTRHHLSRECPLPMYVGLMVHSFTRKKTIVQKLNRLGLSITYDRIQQISATITNEICDLFNENDAVFPASLVANIFTTAAIDNIDHNPSSSTARDSFHGTSITLIQHPDSEMNVGRLDLSAAKWSRTVTSRLPISYTSLPPTSNPTSELSVSTVNSSLSLSHEFDCSELMLPWLDSVSTAIEHEESNGKVSFAAFQSQSSPTVIHKCQSTLLPLLRDEVQTPAMVKHLMEIVKEITVKINVNQAPVITADQPVYALAKNLQWKFPHLYGENEIVVMMGGLHIEMAIQNTIGKWLVGSGWTEIMTIAGVATAGRCESFLHGSHVKRTRYAHEVTLAALHILRKEAFNACYLDAVDGDDITTWINRRTSESAQFQFWNTAITLQTLLLTFVRSIRESNFPLFIDTLKQICPWLFALDMIHYSRWLPVFLKSLHELPVRHPEVHSAFMNGHFTSKKTLRRFSAMSDDQLHEQNNKVIKCDGGASAILDNDDALLKWMVSGPHITEMLSDFEVMSLPHDIHSASCHHEDTQAFRTRYTRHVTAVVKAFGKSGNPFMEASLITVGTNKFIMSDVAENSVREAYSRGKLQYETYVQQRLVLGTASIHDVIPRMKLELFAKISPGKSKEKIHIADLRRDSNIFCKMYIASQSRPSNVDDFFAHENQKFPPSISVLGNMRKPSNKADIVQCMIGYSPQIEIVCPQEPSVTVLILDGAAIVHMLPPGASKTFGEYCSNVFASFIDRVMRNVTRLDIVFDRYLLNSLKAGTRESRGSGQRVKVTHSTSIPKLFNNFLAVNENKQQLFNLLAEFIIECNKWQGKVVICTFDDVVMSSPGDIDVSAISPCDIEEADGRLLLHAKHAFDTNHTKIMIRTVDSDVIVIAASTFNRMSITGQSLQLWIDFGVGKSRRYIAIHLLDTSIPRNVLDNLPFFHAFTGCDTVSAFNGIGKKKAWNVWMKYRAVDEAFHGIPTTEALSIEHNLFMVLQRFVVLMYDQSSQATDVNECRRLLFTKKNRAIESIPPTADALLQHFKRASLQAYVWNASLQQSSINYSPLLFGWTQSCEGRYEPLWMTQADVAQHCSELVTCKCKSRCNSCLCVKQNLTCTKLCACEGQCSRIDIPHEDVEEDCEVDNVVEYISDQEVEQDCEFENVVYCSTEEEDDL